MLNGLVSPISGGEWQAFKCQTKPTIIQRFLNTFSFQDTWDMMDQQLQDLEVSPHLLSV